jgi:hypothetical protein
VFNYDYMNFQASARIHLITKVLKESSYKVSLKILVDPIGLISIKSSVKREGLLAGASCSNRAAELPPVIGPELG